MSYSKTAWSSGDVITAEKLNNLENGIEISNDDFDLVITQQDDIYSMRGLSFDELCAKFEANKMVRLFYKRRVDENTYQQFVLMNAIYYMGDEVNQYPAAIMFTRNNPYYDEGGEVVNLYADGIIDIYPYNDGTWTYDSTTKEYTLNITTK